MTERTVREQQVIPILRRSVVLGGLGILLVSTLVAQEIAGGVTQDLFAEILLTIGLVLIILGAFTAIAHVAAASKVTTREEIQKPTPATDEAEFQAAAEAAVAPGVAVQAASAVITALKETVTALASAPTWATMFVLGVLLLVVASAYDGYNGFGMDVTTRGERQTAVAATVTAQASSISLTATAAASAVSLTMTAEETQFGRTKELIGLGVLPPGHTVKPASPVATPTQ
jgi:hypothetical protein